MKKFCTTLCVVLLLFQMTASAGVIPSDVDVNTPYQPAILKMNQANIVNGYPDGTFRPNQSLTRAEFTKIANLLFTLQSPQAVYTPQVFIDVPTSHWAFAPIANAWEAGYIQGVGENRFAPDDTLTKEQICLMVGRILHFKDLLNLPVDIKDPVSPWAKDAVKTAINCGLFALPGDGNFGATKPITRAELCGALAQYIVTPPTPVKPTDPVTPGGDPTTPPTDPTSQEAQIVANMKKMLDKFKKMDLNTYTKEAVVKDNLNLLMNCMQRALDAHTAGTVLTQGYIAKTFSAEIRQFQAAYATMNQNQSNDLQVIVANLATTAEIQQVMEYFGIATN